LRSYELMYILDPSLDEDASTALVGKVEDLMSKQGVEVENTEPWGKRRLAYRIRGHWEGNYVLSHLKAAPEAISEMERRLRVTDGILRFLTVRMDEEQAKLERQRAHKEGKEQARRARRAARVSASPPATESAAPASPPATESAAPASLPATVPTAESVAPDEAENESKES
jgi:small subunit ribosomal protein S6